MANRIILHIDFNSYFASVEQQANPFLRGKPIGITGKHQERSVVATASIEAKALGVKTAMSTWEAKKICPSLILWPGDPKKYSDITERFNQILKTLAPDVMQFSVDESFVDITQEAGDYFTATCMAQQLRAKLREAFGPHVTASIGIAPNRLMAKLASESVKPNGLTVVHSKNILHLLNTSDLQALCGIGPRIHKRLEALGITNFQQLREYPLTQLKQEFHSYGQWLHEAAWGNDWEGVQDATDKTLRTANEKNPKSYGHSYTLPADTNNPTILKRYLLGLADKVAWRMRRDGFQARRIHTVIRYGDFGSRHEQRTAKEASNNGLNLFKAAWHMLQPHLHTPIRLIGISASQLQHQPPQPPLFKKDQKIQSVTKALDTLQHRYGSGIWKRASTIPITFKSRSSGFHFDHTL